MKLRSNKIISKFINYSDDNYVINSSDSSESHSTDSSESYSTDSSESHSTDISESHSTDSSESNSSESYEINASEVEGLKSDLKENINANTLGKNSTLVDSEKKNINNTYFSSDSEDNSDSDYIPFKNSNSSEYKTLSKYFVFDKEDKHYFLNLDKNDKSKIIDIKNKINNIGINSKPALFRILECKLPIEAKIEILKKYKESRLLDKSSTEYYKVQEYINGILDIPFNKYNDLTINHSETASYIKKSKEILDSIIFGHNKVKLHILEILGQYISAPKSIGNVFGIYGPMGIGKTTLIKEGLSSVLRRPFNFITLGGAGDSSILDGHSYTYEGSRYGKIVECLIKSKCMNPIFYFDELDKVSRTPKGEEIVNLLIHLTDDSQNTKFQDKYYSGIDLNISRAIFVFSFNDLNLINPILRDRLNLIKLDGFSLEEKLTISNNFLLKNILKEFDATEIQFTDECLRFIISKYSNEKGVRELKRKIKDIVSRLNLIKLSKGYLFDSNIINIDSAQPINVTKDLAQKILQ